MQRGMDKVKFEVENHDNFSGVIDQMPNPVIITNADLSIRWVNAAFVELTGWLPQDVMGTQAPYPWWPPARHQEYLAELAKVKTQGKHKSEWLFVRKDGTEFWIEVKARPVVKKGEVQFLVASWLDISDIMNELTELRRIK